MKWTRGDINGAFGDLGTFLPYVVGAITVGGLSVVGVLFGFGVALIGSGLFYGLPMAVQPMKAVSAVLLTSTLTPTEMATAGMMLGGVFLVLGLTGGISWLARVIPQSITTGLVLGLGLAMVLLGSELMLANPWLGMGALAFFLAASRVTSIPLLPAAIVLALIISAVAGVFDPTGLMRFDLTIPTVVLPELSDLPRALELAVLPQIPLTISNAIIVTAAVSASLFPDHAGRVTNRNLAISTGIGNLLLAPLGAMPMCHGAGGVVAQARFGAKTAAAPILLGSLLLVLAVVYGDAVAFLLTTFPLAVAGALLVIAGADLAISRRLLDSRPDCWPVIGVTALVAAFLNPALALVAGAAMEIGRRIISSRHCRHCRPE